MTGHQVLAYVCVAVFSLPYLALAVLGLRALWAWARVDAVDEHFASVPKDDPLPQQAVDHFIDRVERFLKENA